jgi:hypothetical protein
MLALCAWADGTKKERLLATDKEAGGELKGAGAWLIARLQLLCLLYVRQCTILFCVHQIYSNVLVCLREFIRRPTVGARKSQSRDVGLSEHLLERHKCNRLQEP